MPGEQRSLLEFFSPRPTASTTNTISTNTATATSTTATSIITNVSGAKRSRCSAQMALDFGQRDAGGPRVCARCSMLFNALSDEDVRLHQKCCGRIDPYRAKGKQRDNNKDIEKDSDWISSPRAAAGLAALSRQRGALCVMTTATALADTFQCFVLDGGHRGFAEDNVCTRLAAALQLFTPSSSFNSFNSFNSSSSSSCGFSPVVGPFVCVAVVHRPSARLLAAVVGQARTRPQDILVQTPNPSLSNSVPLTVSPRVSLRQCVSLCDVLRVWCAAPLQSLREVTDEALRRALAVLGRHIVYGLALCPRAQFSYDARHCQSDGALSRVEAQLGGGVFTHDEDGEVFTPQGTNSDLSVVSYGE